MWELGRPIRIIPTNEENQFHSRPNAPSGSGTFFSIQHQMVKVMVSERGSEM